jgi:hypothetical protein
VGAHPAVEIAHHTRGRLRLRIPLAKSNPRLLDQVKSAFSGVPGIDDIELRPATCSVLLFYDPEHHADPGVLFKSLGVTPPGPPPRSQSADPVKKPKTNGKGGAKRAKVAEPSLDDPAHPLHPHHVPPKTHIGEIEEEIEAEAEFLAEHSSAAKAIVDLAKQLDRNIKRATNNNVDLKILVPVALAGFTFLEIGAAAATPMWVTLAIFSLNHFVELHAHDADEEDGEDEDEIDDARPA